MSNMEYKNKGKYVSADNSLACEVACVHAIVSNYIHSEDFGSHLTLASCFWYHLPIIYLAITNSCQWKFPNITTN